MAFEEIVFDIYAIRARIVLEVEGWGASVLTKSINSQFDLAAELSLSLYIHPQHWHLIFVCAVIFRDHWSTEKLKLSTSMLHMFIHPQKENTRLLMRKNALVVHNAWQKEFMMRAAFTSAGNIYISEHERNDKKTKEVNLRKKTKEEIRTWRLVFNNSYLFSVIIKSLTKFFLLSYFHHSLFESLAKYTSQFRLRQLGSRLNV